MKTERQTPEEIAERIYDEVIDQITNFNNASGLSRSLVNDWTAYIERLEDQHNKELKEILSDIENEKDKQKRLYLLTETKKTQNHYLAIGLGLNISKEIIDKHIK